MANCCIRFPSACGTGSLHWRAGVPLCLPRHSNTGKGFALFPQGRDISEWALLSCVSLVVCMLWLWGGGEIGGLMPTIITLITWMQNTVLKMHLATLKSLGACSVLDRPPGLSLPQTCEHCVLQPAEEKSQKEQKISSALDGFSARAALSEEQVCGCRRGITAKFTREVNWMDSPHESRLGTRCWCPRLWKDQSCSSKVLLVGDSWGGSGGRLGKGG